MAKIDGFSLKRRSFLDKQCIFWGGRTDVHIFISNKSFWENLACRRQLWEIHVDLGTGIWIRSLSFAKRRVAQDGQVHYEYIWIYVSILVDRGRWSALYRSGLGLWIGLLVYKIRLQKAVRTSIVHLVAGMRLGLWMDILRRETILVERRYMKRVGSAKMVE